MLMVQTKQGPTPTKCIFILIHAWQQCNLYSHSDKGQEIQLIFTSNITMRKNVISVTCMIDCLVWVFLKLLISWISTSNSLWSFYCERQKNSSKQQFFGSKHLVDERSQRKCTGFFSCWQNDFCNSDILNICGEQRNIRKHIISNLGVDEQLPDSQEQKSEAAVTDSSTLDSWWQGKRRLVCWSRDLAKAANGIGSESDTNNTNT